MKRLFCSVILSLMGLFAIWTIIAYVNFGTDMVKYHLDFEATIRRINLVFNSDVFEKFGILSVFRTFKQNLEYVNKFSLTRTAIEQITGNKLVNISTGFNLLLNAIESLFNPIAMACSALYLLVYIPIIILQLILYAINFILGIVEFVVSPVFVRYLP